MDVDRLNTGEKIAAVSAILLFVFMFFDWFGVEVAGFAGATYGGGGNAWDTLDFIPIVLLGTIIAALVMAGLRLSDATVEPIVPMSTLVTVLGVISVLLILFRIVDTPDLGGLDGAVGVDVSLSIGIFLGLISAGGIAYGGYSAMREEGITFGDAADSLSSRRGSTPPPPPPSSTPPPPPAPPAPPAQGTPPPPPPSSPPPPPPPPPSS
jgi:hypothetical protein